MSLAVFPQLQDSPAHDAMTVFDDADQFASRLGGAARDAAPLTILPLRDDTPLLAQFPATEPRRSIGFRPPSADQITAALSSWKSLVTGAPVEITGTLAGTGTGALRTGTGTEACNESKAFSPAKETLTPNNTAAAAYSDLFMFYRSPYK